MSLIGQGCKMSNHLSWLVLIDRGLELSVQVRNNTLPVRFSVYSVLCDLFDKPSLSTWLFWYTRCAIEPLPPIPVGAEHSKFSAESISRDYSIMRSCYTKNWSRSRSGGNGGATENTCSGYLWSDARWCLGNVLFYREFLYRFPASHVFDHWQNYNRTDVSEWYGYWGIVDAIVVLFMAKDKVMKKVSETRKRELERNCWRTKWNNLKTRPIKRLDVFLHGVRVIEYSGWEYCLNFSSN